MAHLQGVKNYSHCPLKKRPLSYVNDIDDEQPQDLSMKRRRHDDDHDVNHAPKSPTPSIEPSMSSYSLPRSYDPAPQSPPQVTSLADFYLKLFQSSSVQQQQYDDIWRRTSAWGPMVHSSPHHHQQHQSPIVAHHQVISTHPILASRLASSPHPSEDRLASPGSTVSEDSGVGAETLSEDEIDVIGDAQKQQQQHNSQQSQHQHLQQSRRPSDVTYEIPREVQTNRGGESRYSCTECTKSYSTYSGLSKHKQFHCASLGNKSFACKHCDKVYTSLGALKMHIRTHTLPCKCPLCGKAFSRPWLLQGHIRTHTGEKPFQCTQCDRCFADRSNLRAHLQTHADVKKYACSTCQKTFSRMSLLNKHTEGACPARLSQQVISQQEFHRPV